VTGDELPEDDELPEEDELPEVDELPEDDELPEVDDPLVPAPEAEVVDDEPVAGDVVVVELVAVRGLAECAVASDATRNPRPATASVAVAARAAVIRRTRTRARSLTVRAGDELGSWEGGAITMPFGRKLVCRTFDRPGRRPSSGPTGSSL
jgi:hypothetical protein